MKSMSNERASDRSHVLLSEKKQRLSRAAIETLIEVRNVWHQGTNVQVQHHRQLESRSFDLFVGCSLVRGDEDIVKELATCHTHTIVSVMRHAMRHARRLQEEIRI